MIHPELQKLLDYALQSGELTQNHKDLIFRKAQELGQDLVTLEMVIESELQKIKKQSAPEKQTNFSCPSCGSSIPKSSIKCGFCGFEITKTEITGAKYIERLQKALEDVNNKKFSFMQDLDQRKSNSMRASIITSFNLPNDKENLMELFFFCDANADAYANIRQFGNPNFHLNSVLFPAWSGKAKMAYNKLQRFVDEDQDINELIQKYKNKYHIEAKDMKQSPIIKNQVNKKGCLPFFVMILIVFTATYLLTKSSPV
jgi:hypothetical protein